MEGPRPTSSPSSRSLDGLTLPQALPSKRIEKVNNASFRVQPPEAWPSVIARVEPGPGYFRTTNWTSQCAQACLSFQGFPEYTSRGPTTERISPYFLRQRVQSLRPW